ncbi:PD-(D/E)XK nuclease family protein [Leptolyngbya sp. AN02str]|uniref:PD-(D/E)XK nuclease family protein n=1 Tax=Leptolyngbya sp. AN02str TaxID=3423363 RepID=UPI003D318AD5
MSTTSLFSRLLSLNTGRIPLEDFFTELVAYLFSQNKEILYAWLQALKLIDATACFDAHVFTQQEFKRLDNHDSESRPDILIKLIGKSGQSMIFVESKIGSHEGHEQLSRYAEILDSFAGFHQSVLIYITRDFEPKNKSDIFKNIPESPVQFKQARWHQFYQFLKPWSKTALVPEIIAFMDENRMARNNQFSSIDIIALANLRNSIKLLDEALGEEVSQKFDQVLSITRRKKQKPIIDGQFNDHGRYVISASLLGGFWCHMGFFLQTPNLTDYPTVRLMLEVDSISDWKSDIVAAMNKISEQYGWACDDLNNSGGWPKVFRESSLRDFLSEDDHIAAIKRFFLQALDELSAIKTQYPQLPWGVVQDQDSEETSPNPSDIYLNSQFE